LNSRLRFATLYHQYDSQATLIANNNDLARYLYYMGRIRALQLQYGDAAQYFQLSLRKAPQDSAIGFKQNINKWVVVISLLRGEIPERAIFRASIHRVTLAPYLQLTHGSFLKLI
jgi:26S proteasome regulatory subunit N3